MKHKNIKKECEELWAKNKYYVLSKSHKAYLDIREYLKEMEVDILSLHEKIQKVRDIKESNLEEKIIESPIYKEHNAEYLIECIENLRKKGIKLEL
ncbi:hypothetical protein GCWU000282_02615 [Catonella morbi ATCC 51271]|uniref:Uncharacterized protein n=1 Tax=Catonella morbi ATCC 51271 TaxID=592026 RepID=V2XJX8_9FIRM|nr:hypothetical protein [Catonella morbi]ESL02479.1 hypothetical protein GCWU000282_02615 [Catonella morbi ATCC 51271]